VGYFSEGASLQERFCGGAKGGLSLRLNGSMAKKPTQISTEVSPNSTEKNLRWRELEVSTFYSVAI
jgi:hypothetical protein